MSKILVAYFSASGVTRKTAERVAKIAGADIYEIAPLIPYTEADLDWTNDKSRSSVEMKDPSSRPQIAGKFPDVSCYDAVLIGFPVWWYVAPTIVNTFIEGVDLSGKTVAVFATSGGSGLGKTESVLKPLCDNSVKWRPGKVLNRATDEDIKKWLNAVL